MSADTCRLWRERLGALLLGHLDPAEEIAVRAHLEICVACRSEAQQLGPVADVLPLADVDRVADRPWPPADLERRVLSRVGDERSRRARSRRRVAEIAVGIAAAVALLVGMWSVTARDGDERRVAFGDLPAGVQVAATVEPKAWGTQVELDVAGLPAGEVYQVWLKGHDGSRVPAGTFVAVPERSTHLVLAAGLGLPAAHGLGVSTADGETIMYGEL